MDKLSQVPQRWNTVDKNSGVLGCDSVIWMSGSTHPMEHYNIPQDLNP